MNAVTDFVKGERVQLHPGTDLWMMGARFGTVTKIGKKLVHVSVDKLNDRVKRIHPDNLMHIDTAWWSK